MNIKKLDAKAKTFGHVDYIFSTEEAEKDFDFLQEKAKSYLIKLFSDSTPVDLVVKSNSVKREIQKQCTATYLGEIELYVSMKDISLALAIINTCYSLGIDITIYTLNSLTMDYVMMPVWSKFF